jgi:two-component system LytT family response regulator
VKKIRTLIVDDEPLARGGIAALLETDAEIEVVGACADGPAAVEEILGLRPDLAFLDVQMPRLSGIEVLERVPAGQCPQAIFVTAYDQHALKAFEVCAVDYLLKPFREARFRAAVSRAKVRIRQSELGDLQLRAAELAELLRLFEPGGSRLAAPSGPAPAPRLVFRAGTGQLFVEPRDIVWAEAQGDRVRLCESGQIHLVQESLQGLEAQLDPAQFVRVHRSFLVNLGRVRKLTPQLYGDGVLTMGDGAKIPVSRTCRAVLKTLLPPAKR